MVQIRGGVTAAKGFTASGIHVGIRKNREKKDLALVWSEKPCSAAAVYTTNQVKGQPLIVTKEHLADGKAQAIIVNAGNANTCTGEAGIAAARRMAALVSQWMGIPATDVVVASTGVIGQQLDVGIIETGMEQLVAGLSRTGNIDAREAIMTTDTVKKEVAVQFELGGRMVSIGAMAKGSGMIHPNMATMLSFITTDCAISPAMLQKALSASVERTYNRVSVDGDTSTNDMVVVLANGMADNPPIETEGPDFRTFYEALTWLNIQLARMIAKDGEGATKLIECTVEGASDEAKAVELAKGVIRSSLVKTAVFGADANWGRILCALGYTRKDFDPAKVDVAFESASGYIEVCKNGAPLSFNEEKAKKILSYQEVTIYVSLNEGAAQATAWGCDLTYEYVRINGDYRT
ncbi:MAG: bifunctional glutamate N-acetyltransferase/amino-acid acetyltransferase ArgJ [Spirochaetia bacterium]|jgi:glutamate N-acetyltransferase/amino-acid N-acetyltransferase|uniref:Arginine biosynthesis bifunctional protein ArgJ n=2 Tax=root TaxID=1 RepID=A0A652ZSQ9_9SPIR|nr:bifunctional glutamate N-acetyltransferase/amino-acid acetyltransferase ArgJ [Spirochaetia bacterium]MDD3819926.1 bifunctional glutamate N-acetyltransferase/amino-acid acetyltransferase ArgJ [Spirochaetales bacterium]NLX44858.1 bifunctional glutamate N-acetyltransferase/amino-acid acetyltransferase ArgJ [Treponema sp.]VBB38786.1 Arginine biosynthesis bifunctional protein ArgJ (Includes: Glutamate N-acetyltransferase; Amino-acid acetyltransferase) [uncultured Spirochaetota bacterium]MCE120938